MAKTGVEINFDDDVLELIENAAKQGNCSKSAVVNAVVRRRFEDPLRVLREKMKIKQIELMNMQEEAMQIEAERAEKQKQKQYLEGIRKESARE